jgi:tetratricopeptide (TPR) repeat protein
MLRVKTTLITLLFAFASLALNAQTPLEKANSAMGLQKWKEAGKNFAKHLKKSPKDSLAWFSKGICSVKDKDYETAISDLEKAQTLNFPNVVGININLSRCYAKTDQKEKAFAALKKATTNGFTVINMLNHPDFSELQADKRMAEARSQIDKNIYPCKYNSNYRKFDFWIGEWDVYVAGGKVATSTITNANGSCAIHEDYKTNGSYTGQSISFYDPAAKTWKQHWVGSSGDVMNFTDTKSDEGDMQYITERLTAAGTKVTTRMTYYYNKEDDTVRQQLEDSADHGDTWTVTFNGTYKRKNK